MDLFEHAQDRREDVAAQKIQAIQRGRQDRERLQAQNASAAKIQSIQRGRQTRKQAQLERRKRQEREAAAEKIQAIQRGRQARKKPLRSQYDWVGGAKGQSFYGGVDLNNAPVATLAADELNEKIREAEEEDLERLVKGRERRRDCTENHLYRARSTQSTRARRDAEHRASGRTAIAALAMYASHA